MDNTVALCRLLNGGGGRLPLRASCSDWEGDGRRAFQDIYGVPLRFVSNARRDDDTHHHRVVVVTHDGGALVVPPAPAGTVALTHDPKGNIPFEQRQGSIRVPQDSRDSWTLAFGSATIREILAPITLEPHHGEALVPSAPFINPKDINQDAKLISPAKDVAAAIRSTVPAMLNTPGPRSVHLWFGISDSKQKRCDAGEQQALVIGCLREWALIGIKEGLASIFPRPSSISLYEHPVFVDHSLWEQRLYADVATERVAALLSHLRGDAHVARTLAGWRVYTSKANVDRTDANFVKSLAWTMDSSEAIEDFEPRTVYHLKVAARPELVGSFVAPIPDVHLPSGTISGEDAALAIWLRTHSFDDSYAALSGLRFSFTRSTSLRVIITADGDRARLARDTLGTYCNNHEDVSSIASVIPGTDIRGLLAELSTYQCATIMFDVRAPLDILAQFQPRATRRLLLAATLDDLVQLRVIAASVPFSDVVMLGIPPRLQRPPNHLAGLVIVPELQEATTAADLFHRYFECPTPEFRPPEEQRLRLLSWLRGELAISGVHRPDWSAALENGGLWFSHVGERMLARTEAALQCARGSTCTLHLVKVLGGCGATATLCALAMRLASRHREGLCVAWASRSLPTDRDSALRLWHALDVHCRHVGCDRLLVVCDSDYNPATFTSLVRDAAIQTTAVAIGCVPDSHSVDLVESFECTPFLTNSEATSLVSVLRQSVPKSADALRRALDGYSEALIHTKHIFVFALAAFSGVHRPAEEWVDQAIDRMSACPQVSSTFQALCTVAAFNHPASARAIDSILVQIMLASASHDALEAFNELVLSVETGIMAESKARAVHPFFARLACDVSITTPCRGTISCGILPGISLLGTEYHREILLPLSYIYMHYHRYHLPYMDIH